MLSDYEYFGIHAVSAYGGDYILTIDDVDIDVVRQYDFEAEEISGDTVMYPGTEAVFHYLVHNTGYDPLDITLHPSNEFFTDISNYANGVAGATFHAEPDETVRVVTCATLRPEIQPGTVAWLDVMMTIPCGCNTAMVTFWVTPLDVTKVPENPVEISIFPNPVTDFVTVKDFEDHKFFFATFQQWMRLCFRAAYPEIIDFSANIKTIGREKQNSRKCFFGMFGFHG